MQPDQRYLFIHIPKTAGTSLRKSAQRFFGTNNVLYDYGKESEETSSLIQKYIYELNDLYELYINTHAKPATFLSGHFSLSKYLPIYNLNNVISFVRIPDQQIYSHFEHFRRWHGYEKSFIEFIQESRFINCQSRQLSVVPIASIGFIGLTEKYDESIDLINKEYGFSIPIEHLNKNEEKSHHQYKLSDEEFDLIKTLNQKDYDLYGKVKELFARRLACQRLKLPFYRGKLTMEAIPKMHSPKYISGWLINYSSNAPSRGYININNFTSLDFEANYYRHMIKERFNHRMGFGGFRLKLHKKLKEGDMIELYDENHHLHDSYVFSTIQK